MKNVGKNPSNQKENTANTLMHWIPNAQKYSVPKAVSDTAGETIGWVCGGRRGYEGDPAPMGNKAVIDKPFTNGDEPTNPIQRLESLTDANLRQWISIFMRPSTQCMYIVSLAVSLPHYSRGVGSSLIRFGTSRANLDGVFCWVHSSEAGQRVFEKEGFRKVGSLEVNLNEYSPVPCPEEGGTGKWGSYGFRYVKRLPKPQ